MLQYLVSADQGRMKDFSVFSRKIAGAQWINHNVHYGLKVHANDLHYFVKRYGMHTFRRMCGLLWRSKQIDKTCVSLIIDSPVLHSTFSNERKIGN